MKQDLDGEVAKLLKTVADHFDKEDRAVRERQIRHMRRLKLYWNNFSLIYWNEVAHDYRIAGGVGNLGTGDESSQDYYDRPVNVFKAFLETIIAALSVQIPAVTCVPDDADNPLDLSTAKAGNIIANQIYKHNDVMFLWLQALYIYCTEGLIACYSYPKEDKKYGTYDTPKYKDEEVESYVCPSCGERIPDEIFSNLEMDEYGPDDDDVKLHDLIERDGPVCAQCGMMLDPALQKTKLIVSRLIGTTTHPKSRVCLEVYGGLYIKIANYAKKQKDTPYLIFSYETHYANVLECYPKLRDKIAHGGEIADPYEQYGRLNTQYRGETPDENVTVKNFWLRCAAFNILPEVDYNKLKRNFPDGVKVVLVNDVCAEYENESLDDCWTLTHNPMSDFLNHEPLGELLTNIQDIVNDLISLTLQTIEHGIAQTFADPAVVDFGGQRQIEAMPGTLTPAKPQGGSKNISEGFYNLQTAALAPEVFNFYRIIQELGQFVSGALPALFGGQQQAGSSRTASEYAMSRSMALQRLQTPWKMLTIWWKEIFGKAIPLYMKLLVEDERLVQKDQMGNFVNVFIRKAEIEGRIGDFELEPGEHLPVTDEQQSEVIMRLMEMNNEIITGALFDPDNLEYVRKVIKIPQFKIPGEDDRQKQYEEINELINSVPIVGAPDEQQMAEAIESGQEIQPVEQPSVSIDPDVDNHQIEAAICRSWLVSEAGRQAKIENPEGYKNVLLHMKAHQMIVQQQMLAQQMQQVQSNMVSNATNDSGDKNGAKSPNSGANGGGVNNKPKPKQSEKVDGESNVRNPVS